MHRGYFGPEAQGEYFGNQSLYPGKMAGIPLNPLGISCGAAKIVVNGAECHEIELRDDGRFHEVTVIMGRQE